MTVEFEGYEIAMPKARHHNEVDHEQFKEAHRSILERHNDESPEARKKLLLSRLELWDQQTAPRWKKATLGQVDEHVSKRVQKIMGSSKSAQSFYIHSVDPFQSTYLAHAIARRYIGHGKMTPSRIVKISEDELLGYATAGFTGKDAIAKLLSKKNTVYILDNAGARPEYNEKFEIPVLEQLMSHVYGEDKKMILVSQVPMHEYKSLFSPSSQARLDGLFGSSIIDLTDNRPEVDIFAEESGTDGLDGSTLGLFEG